jgi:hypothetical protein
MLAAEAALTTLLVVRVPGGQHSCNCPYPAGIPHSKLPYLPFFPPCARKVVCCSTSGDSCKHGSMRCFSPEAVCLEMPSQRAPLGGHARAAAQQSQGPSNATLPAPLHCALQVVFRSTICREHGLHAAQAGVAGMRQARLLHMSHKLLSCIATTASSPVAVLLGATVAHHKG